jgi:hypothetical protein
VAFLADMENLPVDLAVRPAAGRAQRAHRLGGDEPGRHAGPCAVAHGNLSVTISSTPGQPARAAGGGQTVVTEKADIAITQQGGLADPAARRRQAGRRGEGAQRAGRHAAGPAGHPAGHEEPPARCNAELEVI